MSAKSKRILGWCMIALPFAVMGGILTVVVPQALIGILIFGAILWLFSTGAKLIASEKVEEGEQGAIDYPLKSCPTCGSQLSNKSTRCLVCGWTY